MHYGFLERFAAIVDLFSFQDYLFRMCERPDNTPGALSLLHAD
jgi:hypothetical protein